MTASPPLLPSARLGPLPPDLPAALTAEHRPCRSAESPPFGAGRQERRVVVAGPASTWAVARTSLRHIMYSWSILWPWGSNVILPQPTPSK